MGRLLQEARSLYDLVICDCAPVLAVAETQILAQRADKTVLVARWGKTPAKAARAALRLLASAEVDLAGVALNAVDVRSAVGGYYDTRYYARRYANYYSG
jgi:Mrp family chromosome partitioning ATPase